MITRHLASLTDDTGAKFSLLHLVGEVSAFCLDRTLADQNERINLSNVFSRPESTIWLGAPHHVVLKPQLQETQDETAVAITVESLGDVFDIVIDKALFSQDNHSELPSLADYVKFYMTAN